TRPGAVPDDLRPGREEHLYRGLLPLYPDVAEMMTTPRGCGPVTPASSPTSGPAPRLHHPLRLLGVFRRQWLVPGPERLRAQPRPLLADALDRRLVGQVPVFDGFDPGVEHPPGRLGRVNV